MTDANDWRAECVRLISSGDRDDWDRARALKLAQMPASLFRYRFPTARSLDGLERGTIWLSAASSFNDLYDSAVAIDAATGVRDGLQRHGSTGMPAVPPQMAARISSAPDPLAAIDELLVEAVAKQAGPDVARRAKNFFKEFLADQSVEWTAKATQFFQRGTKVACFSEVADAPLLWAHYADQNAGFCVEYDFSQIGADDLRRHMLWPVVYSAERFSFTRLLVALSGAPNPFIAAIASIHKSLDWAYEREWRIVVPLGGDTAGLEWTMPTPKAVYLGSRMAVDHRERITAFAHGRGIALLEMRGHADQYGVSAKPIA
jgi:hypothetical protein